MLQYYLSAVDEAPLLRQRQQRGMEMRNAQSEEDDRDLQTPPPRPLPGAQRLGHVNIFYNGDNRAKTTMIRTLNSEV